MERGSRREDQINDRGRGRKTQIKSSAIDVPREPLPWIEDGWMDEMRQGGGMAWTSGGPNVFDLGGPSMELFLLITYKDVKKIKTTGTADEREESGRRRTTQKRTQQLNGAHTKTKQKKKIS
jgi:hypothetical protein